MQILTAHYAPLRCSVLVHPNANMVLDPAPVGEECGLNELS